MDELRFYYRRLLQLLDTDYNTIGKSISDDLAAIYKRRILKEKEDIEKNYRQLK